MSITEYFFKKHLTKLLIEGQRGEEKLFRAIHEEYRSIYYEDNNATRNAQLQESFDAASPAVMYRGKTS